MAIAGTAAGPAAVGKGWNYRVCLETGLHIDLAAQRLIKANAFVGVLFLAVGGLFGLMVALTRW
jgi:cytochrome c oxidase subunit I